MGHTIKLAALGAVAFMVLDGIWLGVLMKNFYRNQLAPIVRLGELRVPQTLRVAHAATVSREKNNPRGRGLSALERT